MSKLLLKSRCASMTATGDNAESERRHTRKGGKFAKKGTGTSKVIAAK